MAILTTSNKTISRFYFSFTAVQTQPRYSEIRKNVPSRLSAFALLSFVLVVIFVES